MNLEALGAMDDCEHATGKPLEAHVKGCGGKETVAHPRTAKEIVADYLEREVPMDLLPPETPQGFADGILKALKDGGYDVLEVVSYG